MSRSVAGFAILFYVCIVSGQQYPRIRLKGTGNEPSIAIGAISGGDYPAGSFSIGHGDNNENGDGGPGADYGGNVYPNYGGNGQVDPNSQNGGQGQGGYINGNNDLGGYGNQNPNGYNSQNGGVNGYDVPTQNNNYGEQPPNPYDNNYKNSQTNNVPVRNSASRNRFYSSFLRYLLSWF